MPIINCKVILHLNSTYKRYQSLEERPLRKFTKARMKLWAENRINERYMVCMLHVISFFKEFEGSRQLLMLISKYCNKEYN